MRKRTFTALFILGSTVANIALALVIITALVAVTGIVMSRLLGITEGMAYLMVWLLCFFGGVILNMIVFARLTNWVIVRFHLATKLDERLMGRRIPGARAAAEPPKRKTNLPDFAKPRAEDEWAEQIENSEYSTYQNLGLQELQARAMHGAEGGGAAGSTCSPLPPQPNQ